MSHRLLRRLSLLLLSTLLAVPAAAQAQTQGAGDNQYQDPFSAGGGSSRTSAQPHVSHARRQRQGGSLSPTPPPMPPRSGSSSGSSGSSSGSSGASSGSSGSSRSSGSSSSSSAPSSSLRSSSGSSSSRASSTATLARTGIDADALALLGAGLLLTGIGLRLRVVDERPA